MAPNPELMERGNVETETHTEATHTHTESHVNMKVGVGVKLRNDRDCWQTIRSLDRVRIDSPSKSKKKPTLLTLILNF